MIRTTMLTRPKTAALALAIVLAIVPTSQPSARGGAGEGGGGVDVGGGGGGVGGGGGGGAAEVGGGGEAGAGLSTLKGQPVPLPDNLGDFVADQDAAIRLGKALFWDMQTGGDGAQACASCHWQAGSDLRTKDMINPGADHVFQTGKPNSALKASQFPVNTGDVIGSSGEIKRTFNGIVLKKAADKCTQQPDPIFGKGVRQVTGRNAPSAVNAIFNFRSFWDGRANNTFNGANPAGPTDPTATVLQVDGGVPTPVQIALANASLASQAVGPPNNGTEMSCAGRVFPQLGRKMMALKPLGKQAVSKTDSVLGALSGGTGLKTTYPDMIKAAFLPEWWDSSAVVGGFTVMENNFSLYWGLSIMLYESTLVSDDSRVDRFLAGDAGALSATEQLGLSVFQGKGRCDHCHGGAVTSDATVADGALAGFHNSAVRPVPEDAGDIVQGNGMFKTPTIRNSELNGPYFHNGGMATLRQVVDFYDRGGDFPSKFTDSQVRVLQLTEQEKSALVALMVAYTDDRVRYERAPFDHPALTIPNGTAIAAVGAAGRTKPVRSFLGLDPFQP